ncbi:flavin reductase (NADH) [Gemmobacter megaterium]|uniref:Flavin reductase (NADH) n=1 Tax=Gemmobacter megaterium TaxID=1086013 RepID=A0A1N7LTQ8_9RHOB|nr:flavin reductase family protein [Gemmobacter megaterium]GGE10664.1 flavin oxidoreductase [Gemmobacter megaterium]SIS77154.1 flavin reductase (NADH) [Gemmobacter megaterium]
MGVPVDAATFRAAMARFPGAVTIITTAGGGERRGITATAVCSVTADPPSLLVCLNRATGTCAMVADTGMFNVSLLAGDGGSTAMRFAGAGGVTGEDKFAQGRWLTCERGLPMLADAVVTFCCEVAEQVQAGSHTVMIGRIVGVRLNDGAPLVYEQSRFHRLEPI